MKPNAAASDARPDPARVDDDADEAPELTEEFLADGAWLAHGQPATREQARAVLHENLAATAAARRPGRPRLTAPKVATKLRLDADVLERFRAGGPGWQTRINAALREWCETHDQAAR